MLSVWSEYDHIDQVYCTLSYIENDAKIFTTQYTYTWKVAEKGFKMAYNMNKLAMNNSCEIIVKI
jgi:hypothetical protein